MTWQNCSLIFNMRVFLASVCSTSGTQAFGYVSIASITDNFFISASGEEAKTGRVCSVPTWLDRLHSAICATVINPIRS